MPEERTYTEEEIQDLTDRVFLLKESLEAGRMHFADHLRDDFLRSYERIKLRPDGHVDPATVDGRIRASTLAIRAMKYREEAKKEISLGQIQEAYFKILFDNFGQLYEQMVAGGLSPAAAGRLAARDTVFVDHVVEVLPRLVEHLKEFWLAVGDPGSYHLQDQQTLKTTFAGDLFPAYWENAVSTAGLYVDTIILPCPVMRTAPVSASNASKRWLVATLVKHVLTAMTYRDVAVAEVFPPIALVLPNTADIVADTRKGLIDRSVPLMLRHAAHLFGRDFESLEELEEFCGALATVDQVLRELKGSERLVFDADWGSAKEQLTRVVSKESSHPLPLGANFEHAGHHVLGNVLGRMPQAMAAQENAIHFGGTPLINAQTSWLYFNWMLDYQAQALPSQGGALESMHVVRALTAESGNNLAWLGNVPPQTVLELRRNGVADEVRGLLGEGVSELVHADPGNYFRTADQVVENLDKAFRKHQQSLLEARNNKLKFYGLDVTSMIAVGSVGVAAAITGSPALGAISGVLGVAGLPSFKDIKTKFAALAEEERVRRSSPTGLLFRHLR